MANNHTEPIKENFNLQGFTFYSPYVEKLKLYNEYFRQGNMWDKNKYELWEHEKAVLHWAWSNRHKHLGSPITTDVLKREYGILDYQDKGIRLLVRNSTELVEQMKSVNGNWLEPIIENIAHKGLGDIVGTYTKTQTRSGVIQLDGKPVSEEEIKGVFIYSILINRRGLLVGELIEEKEKKALWVYRLSVIVLRLSVILIISSLIFTIFSSTFEEINKISIGDVVHLFELSPYVTCVLFVIGAWLLGRHS